jgi:hypothetical protein
LIVIGTSVFVITPVDISMTSGGGDLDGFGVGVAVGIDDGSLLGCDDG